MKPHFSNSTNTVLDLTVYKLFSLRVPSNIINGLRSLIVTLSNSKYKLIANQCHTKPDTNLKKMHERRFTCRCLHQMCIPWNKRM